MKRILFISAILLISSVQLAYAQADTVIERYRRFLLQTTELDPVMINRWVTTIGGNGRWPDINYDDQSRANWQLWEHLKRLDQLAVAWCKPASLFYRDGRLWQAISLGINDWLRYKYQNPNWWHNQIGVPQAMRDLVILLRDTLTESQTRNALTVIRQLHVQGPGAGANLTWSADLGLHYGALVHDLPLMDSCRNLIADEIHISTGEGIQPDYSFHQHGSRLQMYQYGKAFLFTNIRIAWELRGTRWALPQEKLDILTRFLLKGWQWMARGINTVPGTMDRSSSRAGELRSPDIRYLIPFLTELDPEKTKAFTELLVHQNGTGSLHGFRSYPYSDFTAYQEKLFSFFLKTMSTRTLPAEVGLNNENLKGNLLNSGDTYLVQNGNEYYNLMPVWDWKKLPGITAFKRAYKIERKPFAGSVSDSWSGLAVMDYVIADKGGNQKISARKAWVCHKGVIVCLIGNLSFQNLKDTGYTVMDQSRLQGDVFVNHATEPISMGNHRLNHVKWIYHHRFIYIPLNTHTVELSAGRATGNWAAINTSESDSLITDSVFMPVILHPATRSGFPTGTGYVLSYGNNPRDAELLYRHPTYAIVRNDKNCQAVQFKDGTLFAAFYAQGSLSTKKHSIQVDKPCLIQVSNSHLYISDPLHTGGQRTIRIGHSTIKVILANDGSTKTIVLK